MQTPHQMKRMADTPTTLPPDHPLHILWAAREPLTRGEQATFDALLIGHLSALVTDAVFVAAVGECKALVTP